MCRARRSRPPPRGRGGRVGSFGGAAGSSAAAPVFETAVVFLDAPGRPAAGLPVASSIAGSPAGRRGSPGAGWIPRTSTRRGPGGQSPQPRSARALHVRVLDLPAAGHLLHDQLGVHPDVDISSRRARRGREAGDQAAVLGDVVAGDAEAVAALGEHLAGRRRRHDGAEPAGPGLPRDPPSASTTTCDVTDPTPRSGPGSRRTSSHCMTSSAAARLDLVDWCCGRSRSGRRRSGGRAAGAAPMPRCSRTRS